MRILLTGLLAAFCASLTLSLSDGVAAEDSRLLLQPGVKVKSTGKASGAMTSAGGLQGTFECRCAGQGTCTLVTDSNSVQCYKGADDTCPNNCVFKTTTRGAKLSTFFR